MNRIATFVIILSILTSCATHGPMITDALQPGRLPTPNITLKIPGLGPCTDSPNRNLNFNSSQPITVLVHGCFGSSGQFRALAQVLAFHGQQSACFTYDDRDKLTRSASDLTNALKQLAEQSHVPSITLIGHSQGALIARKSVTESLLGRSPLPQANLRLVTISGPFAGIESAKTCGRSWLGALTLGLIPLSCYAVTGAKWADITYSSRFIRNPGTLAPQVTNYLKIDTDERNTCRREQDGRCIEKDEIFSLAEQRSRKVETESRIKRVEINAGHVEIVGDKHVAPIKLIAILQNEGVILPTAPQQLPEFSLLLSKIY